MKRIIKKAKLKSRSLEVELTETVETDNGQVTNEVIMKCAGLVHDDLRKVFQRLVLHMILVCDLKKADHINLDTFEMDNLSEFDDYEVKGFTIGGQDDHEGVVIIGSRKLDNGKVLNIVTPFTKFTDEHAPYDYESELFNDIQACLYEVEQYLEGKYAIKQLELPFDEVNVLEEKENAA